MYHPAAASDMTFVRLNNYSCHITGFQRVMAKTNTMSEHVQYFVCCSFAFELFTFLFSLHRLI